MDFILVVAALIVICITIMGNIESVIWRQRLRVLILGLTVIGVFLGAVYLFFTTLVGIPGDVR